MGAIRIGIVGAGQIARTRHLPGFRALSGVRVVGVCNQRRESSSRVAREFDIPKVYGNWEELIEDDDDRRGRDRDLAVPPLPDHPGGARRRQARPDPGPDGDERAGKPSGCSTGRASARALTTMVVPSPYGLVGDTFVRSLIDDGYLGTLREVHVTGLSSDLADPSTPLGWRQMTKYSGFNMLTARHPARVGDALDAPGPAGDRLGLEADPGPGRPRDRQAGQGGHGRQRAGAHELSGGRPGDLPAQRRGLARDRLVDCAVRVGGDTASTT